jgi:hypothetical protein
VAEAGPAVLSRLQDRMAQNSPAIAAYLVLKELDPSTPEPTEEILHKAKEFAVLYYAQGPATVVCPYFRERAWLQGYAAATGIPLTFPHVEAVTKS